MIFIRRGKCFLRAPQAQAFSRGEGAERSEADEEFGRRPFEFRPKTDLLIGLFLIQNRKIFARIPHQSPPCGGDSFPPGGSLCVPQGGADRKGRFLYNRIKSHFTSGRKHFLTFSLVNGILCPEGGNL